MLAGGAVVQRKGGEVDSKPPPKEQPSAPPHESPLISEEQREEFNSTTAALSNDRLQETVIDSTTCDADLNGIGPSSSEITDEGSSSCSSGVVSQEIEEPSSTEASVGTSTTVTPSSPMDLPTSTGQVTPYLEIDERSVEEKHENGVEKTESTVLIAQKSKARLPPKLIQTKLDQIVEKLTGQNGMVEKKKTEKPAAEDTSKGNKSPSSPAAAAASTKEIVDLTNSPTIESEEQVKPVKWAIMKKDNIKKQMPFILPKPSLSNYGPLNPPRIPSVPAKADLSSKGVTLTPSKASSEPFPLVTVPPSITVSPSGGGYIEDASRVTRNGSTKIDSLIRPTALVNPFPPPPAVTVASSSSRRPHQAFKATQIDVDLSTAYDMTEGVVLNGSAQAWRAKNFNPEFPVQDSKRISLVGRSGRGQCHRPTQTSDSPKARSAPGGQSTRGGAVKKKQLKSVIAQLGGISDVGYFQKLLASQQQLPQSGVGQESSYSMSCVRSCSGGEVLVTETPSIKPTNVVADISVIDRLKRLGTVIEIEGEREGSSNAKAVRDTVEKEPSALKLLEKMTIESPQSPVITALDDRPLFLGKDISVFAKKKGHFSLPPMDIAPLSIIPIPPPLPLPPEVEVINLGPPVPTTECAAPASKSVNEQFSTEDPPSNFLEPVIDIHEVESVLSPEGKFVFRMESFHSMDLPNEQKVFSCDICSAAYHHSHMLRKHYIRLHISRRYIAEKDMETYNIDPEPNALEKDDSKYIFRCHTCRKCLPTKAELKSHLTDHPPVSELNKHIKGVKDYRCENCSMYFKWRKRYGKHKKMCKPQPKTQPPKSQKSESPSPTPVPPSTPPNDKAAEPKVILHHCLYCNETFNNANKKRTHTLSYHPYCRKIHPCNFCKAEPFTTNMLLFAHLLTEHQDVYFGCQPCKERFSSLEELKEHNVVKKHVDSTTELTEITKASKPQETFTCNSCQRMFLIKECFDEHKCTLEKEKPDKAAEKAARLAKLRKAKPPDRPERTVINRTNVDPETMFYSQVSQNVQNNLLHYLDGKLGHGKDDASSCSSISSSPGNERHSQENLSSSATNASRYLNFSDGLPNSSLSSVPDPPPVNRAKAQWEKYSFPKNYDGRCGLTSYIKDMSYLDISTQLIMRRNLQRLHGEAESINANANEDVPSVLALERLGAQNAESFGPLKPIQGELSGEWVRDRTYICSVCSWESPCLWTMEDHKYAAHPQVLCPQYELVGDQRSLADTIYKRLVPIPASEMFSYTRSPPKYEHKKHPLICTKCSASGFANSPELHVHILACAGEPIPSWTPSSKRRRWRKRRRPRRGLKRNIPSTPQRPIKLRTKPGDTDTIQKMIANLPPKRAIRRVIGFDETDLKTRSQSTIQNPQTSTHSSAKLHGSKSNKNTPSKKEDQSGSLSKKDDKRPDSHHLLQKPTGGPRSDRDDLDEPMKIKGPSKETDLIDTSAERGDVLSSLRMMPVATPREELLEPRQIIDKVMNLTVPEAEDDEDTTSHMCNGCGQESDTKLSLRKHQKSCAYFRECGPAVSEHKCKTCSRVFDYLLALIEHSCDEMPKLEIEKDVSPVNTNSKEIPVLSPVVAEGKAIACDALESTICGISFVDGLIKYETVASVSEETQKILSSEGVRPRSRKRSLANAPAASTPITSPKKLQTSQPVSGPGRSKRSVASTNEHSSPTSTSLSNSSATKDELPVRRATRASAPNQLPIPPLESPKRRRKRKNQTETNESSDPKNVDSKEKEEKVEEESEKTKEVEEEAESVVDVLEKEVDETKEKEDEIKEDDPKEEDQTTIVPIEVDESLQVEEIKDDIVETISDESGENPKEKSEPEPDPEKEEEKEPDVADPPKKTAKKTRFGRKRKRGNGGGAVLENTTVAEAETTEVEGEVVPVQVIVEDNKAKEENVILSVVENEVKKRILGRKERSGTEKKLEPSLPDPYAYSEDEIVPFQEPRNKPISPPKVFSYSSSQSSVGKRRNRKRDDSPDTTTIVVRAEVHPEPRRKVTSSENGTDLLKRSRDEVPEPDTVKKLKLETETNEDVEKEEKAENTGDIDEDERSKEEPPPTLEQEVELPKDVPNEETQEDDSKEDQPPELPPQIVLTESGDPPKLDAIPTEETDVKKKKKLRVTKKDLKLIKIKALKALKRKERLKKQKKSTEVVEIAGFSWEVSELEKSPPKSEPLIVDWQNPMGPTPPSTTLPTIPPPPPIWETAPNQVITPVQPVTSSTVAPPIADTSSPALTPPVSQNPVSSISSEPPQSSVPVPSLGSILDSVNKLLNEPESNYSPLGPPHYSLADLQRAMGASDAEMAVLQQLGEASAACLMDGSSGGAAATPGVPGEEWNSATGSDSPSNGSAPIIIDLDNQAAQQPIVSSSVVQDDEETENRTTQEESMPSEPPAPPPTDSSATPSTPLEPPPIKFIKDEPVFQKNNLPPCCKRPRYDSRSSSTSLLDAHNHKEVVCPTCSSHFMGFTALQLHVNKVHNNHRDPNQVTGLNRRVALESARLCSRLVCFECSQILPSHLMYGHLENEHSLDQTHVSKCSTVSGDPMEVGGERLKSKMSSALGDLLGKAVTNLLTAKSKSENNTLSGSAVELLTRLCAVRKKENPTKNRVHSAKEIFTKLKLDIKTTEDEWARPLASKPFLCFVCGQRFPLASSRNKHEVLAHRSFRPNEDYNNTNEMEQFEYDDWREAPSPTGSSVEGNDDSGLTPLCSDCGLGFESVGELVKHRGEYHATRRRLSVTSEANAPASTTSTRDAAPSDPCSCTSSNVTKGSSTTATITTTTASSGRGRSRRNSNLDVIAQQSAKESDSSGSSLSKLVDRRSSVSSPTPSTSSNASSTSTTSAPKTRKSSSLSSTGKTSAGGVVVQAKAVAALRQLNIPRHRYSDVN